MVNDAKHLNYIRVCWWGSFILIGVCYQMKREITQNTDRQLLTEVLSPKLYHSRLDSF